MDTSSALTPGELPLDTTGRINADVRCLACGYNLRGLLPYSRCPDCGTAVGRSAYGDLLRFCEPDWVETLARGMNWIVAGICLSLLTIIVMTVANTVLAMRGGSSSVLMKVWVGPADYAVS